MISLQIENSKISSYLIRVICMSNQKGALTEPNWSQAQAASHKLKMSSINLQTTKMFNPLIFTLTIETFSNEISLVNFEQNFK